MQPTAYDVGFQKHRIQQQRYTSLLFRRHRLHAPGTTMRGNSLDEFRAKLFNSKGQHGGRTANLASLTHDDCSDRALKTSGGAVVIGCVLALALAQNSTAPSLESQ